MPHVCRIVAAFVMLSPWALASAADLSIVSYQYQGETPYTLTKTFVSYKATVANHGAAVDGATATVTSQSAGTETIPGQNVLHFGPVAANSQVQSTDSFTILVDQSQPFDFGNLQWSFSNPSANAGPNQTKAVQSTVTLDGSKSSDPSGSGPLTFAWSFVSIPAGSRAALQGADTVTPSFVVDVPGDYVIRLTVSNGAGTDSATVTISTVNSRPSANAGANQTVALHSLVSLSGARSSDVDGDRLTFAWKFVARPAGSSAALINPTSVMPAFVADAAGAYVVELVANDGSADSAASVVVISTGNTAPVANAGTDQVVSPGAFVQLNGARSTDVDGDALKFHWSFLATPAGSQAAVSDSKAVNPSFTADLPGTYLLQLIVNDGHVDSTPATVAIHTSGTLPPTAQAGSNRTVATGKTVTLASSNPQSSPLSSLWSLIAAPAGSTAVLSTRITENPTFVADVPGTYVAQLVVNDGNNHSVPSTVVVTTANTPPTANAGSNDTSPVGALITLNGNSSSDPDNDPLSYRWSLISIPPGSSARLEAANTAKPSFTADVAGTYVAQLIVNDGFANSDPSTVVISANAMKLTLSPDPMNLTTSASTLTVNLSVPAGDAGQVVNFSGFDPNIIDVPTSIVVPQNATGVNVQVTPKGSGNTTVTASGSPFDAGNASINVGADSSKGPERPKAVTGPISVSVVTGSLQNAKIDTAFSSLLKVVVLDGRKKPVSGAIVTFMAPDSGASGVFAGGQNVSVTNGAGVATSEVFSANGVAGAYAVTAVVNAAVPSAEVTSLTGANVVTADFSLANTAESPASITAIRGMQQSAMINTGFSNPLQAMVKDASGKPISGAVVRFNAPKAGASSAFAGDAKAATTDENGIATSAMLTANSKAGTYKVKASVNTRSTVFSLTNASGPPSSMKILSGDKQHAQIDTTFSKRLVVRVSDAGGNAVVGATVTFTAPAAGAGGTFVGGVNTAITDGNGKAASAMFTANSTTGAYTVMVAIGAVSSNFSLTNTPAPPASLTVVSGSPQSAAINTTFTNPLVVIAKDAHGNPVSGAKVEFNAPASGASGAFAGGHGTAVTDATGTATSPLFTANLKVGLYTVTATLGALSANFTLTNTAGGPASIAVVSGSPQNSPTNTSFAKSLVVLVKDAGGNPVTGVVVTFTAPGSGASGAFAGGVNTATTDVAGRATSAAFTANGTAGSYTVTATTGALSANFSLTNTAGAPASITMFSGSPQSAGINTAFASPLVALVQDSGGNPVSGVVVTFTAPASGASGAFDRGVKTATTDAAGKATSAVFKANGTMGSYTVTAATGVWSANFSLTNTVGSAVSIAVSSGSPQSAAINAAFANPLVALVTDSGGNPVSGVVVTFTAPASGAGGTFAGGVNTATTDAGGKATSAVFTANATAGSYTVTAKTGALSAKFSLTNTAGAAASIAVSSGSPQSAVINTAFAGRLVAIVEDSGGNPLSGVIVTFNVPASGASGTFTGGVNTATTDAAGKATSAAFKANGTVGGYTVTATTGALSANFSLTNTAGAAASIAVSSGSPQSAIINTAFANPLVALVKDTGGNPVSGVVVTFTAPGTGASGAFAGGVNTAATDVNGKATSAVFTANGTAGGYTVTVKVGTLSASFSLTNTVGSPASIAVSSGSPQSAAVNAAFANPLVAIVKDAGANPVSGVVVTFTAPASGAGGAFAGGVNTATTDANGKATSAVFTANSTAGGYTVTATTGALSANFSLTNTAGAAASIAVSSGSPQSAAISTAFGNPLVALVKDAGGNPVSGVVVTFTAPGSGASGTFTGGVKTATTDAAGKATSAVFKANSTVGSYTVLATTGALSAGFSLTNTVGSPASIAVSSGSPQSAAINAAFANPLVALVEDSGGNPVSGIVVTFSAPGSGASGTFAGGVNTATTDANGKATSAVFTANATAGGYTVTAATGALSANFSLTNTAGAAASIAVSSGSPQSTAISTAFASRLVAIVQDSGGNPVSGVVVTFTAPASGASGTFTGGVNTATTDAAGKATSAAFKANGTVGGYTVTATTGALSANFSLTNTAGAAASITMSSGSPQSATINTAFANPLVALVKDSGGNPVSGVVVTFTAPGSGASGTFAGGVNTATTDANGLATSAGFTANGTAGGYTVTAKTGALSAGFSLTNTAGPSASIVVSSGSPQSATINTAFANPLVALVKDGGGNPVSGVVVTFTAPASGASGSFAGGVNTATTDASGKATSAVFTANGTAGGYIVMAATASLSANFSLTNTAGAPASIGVSSGSPQSTQVSTAFASRLVALVQDSGGNPVSGVVVTFVAPASGASGTFTGGVKTATTDASGIATSAVFNANGTAGAYTVTAKTGTLSTTFSLTNTPGAAASIAVSSGSPQSAGINTAFANPLVALVKDSTGNPVSGVVVTFVAPASGASGTFAGGVNTATTDANGKATSAVFTANATAGGYTVTATTAALSANFSLTNTVGAPASIAVSSGSPQSAAINTAFANALVALVKDSGGNPVSGVVVTFNAPASGASGTFTGGVNTATTDASGKATSAVFKANGTAGSYTVTATTGALSANFSLTNTVGAPASIAVFSGSPQSAAINTAFGNALVALVKDAGGNPVSGVVVTFNAPASGASGTFAGGVNTATTDANGKATSVVFTANGTAGSYTVTATTGALSANFSLTNTAGAAASIAVFSGSPQTTGINTAFANPLVALVKDSGGNPLSGILVTFHAPASGASGAFAGGVNTATTDATGKATSAIFTANGTLGGYTVTATTGALSAGFSLTNTAGSPASIAVSSGSPQSTGISTAFANPLVALVKDSGGNPLSGILVTFNVPGSGASGTFAGGVNTATTDATGKATSAAFTANNKSGNYTVTATVGALSANFSLTNQAGAPAAIAVSSGSGQSAVIQTAYASPLRALVTDASNNPVSGVTVTFTPPSVGPTVTFSGLKNTAVTDSNGIATSVAMTANSAAGTFSITATAGLLTTQFSLTNRAGAPFFITPMSGDQQSASVNTAFTNPLQVKVADVGSNPIPGATVTFAAPASGASATFAGNVNTAVTDATGVATSQVLTANGATGVYSIVTSVSGLATTASFTLTNTGVIVQNGTITVSAATVGKNLQTGITITLNPPAPSPNGVTLTIASSDPSLVLVGGGVAAGKGQIQPLISAGTTEISTNVQALAASGGAQIVVSAPGYIQGTALITLAQSGFVIQGPNGIGQPFSTFRGVSTPLTVMPGYLDLSGNFVANQAIAGGVSVNIGVSTDVPGVGTTSPSSVGLGATVSSANLNFVASNLTTGTTDVIVDNTTAGFTTPASGSRLQATVQVTDLVPFSANIGAGLETVVNASLDAPASVATQVKFHTNDATKLRFSTDPTLLGSASQDLVVTIPQGQTQSPDVYAQAVGAAGSSPTYTLSATGFTGVQGSVSIVPAGLEIQSPGGIGAPSFSEPLAAASVNLTVITGSAPAGVFTDVQPVIGGGSVSVSVAVPANMQSVATVATSPISITGGSNNASTVLQLVGNGSATATASATGFTSASVTATITTSSLTIDTGVLVGHNLEQQANVLIGAPAGSGGDSVTIQSNSASLLLAVNPTDVGKSQITVPIAALSRVGTFYIYALADSGSGTYTATGTGGSATGTADFTNAGFVILPTGPTSLNHTTQTSTQLQIFGVLLDASGNLLNGGQTEPLAGNQSLNVSLQSSSGAATVPATVSVAPGGAQATALVPVSIVSAGTPIISVTQPPTFTMPNVDTSVTLNIQ